MRCSFALFSGLSRFSTVPAGRAANAWSVGAKTVNGPAPFSVVTRYAAWRAFASVGNDPAATAVSTASGGRDCAVSGANRPTPNTTTSQRATTVDFMALLLL